MKARIFIVALVVAVVATHACTVEDAIETTTGDSPQDVAERTCREQKWNCQRVYQFATPEENPLGFVEMCVHKDDLASAEAMYGASQWTTHERFQSYYLLGVEPMCIWQCSYAPGPGFGCNAYSGCWCPAEPTPPAPPAPDAGVDAAPNDMLPVHP